MLSGSLHVDFHFDSAPSPWVSATTKTGQNRKLVARFVFSVNNLESPVDNLAFEVVLETETYGRDKYVCTITVNCEAFSLHMVAG